eukprot:3310240-Pyramimonas_sp.AAC.1
MVKYILERRRCTAGRHHPRPASNLQPSSSRRALWEPAIVQSPDSRARDPRAQVSSRKRHSGPCLWRR